MAEGELLAIADELYAAPMAEFTPLRDARAKALKGEKSPLAPAVKALKKPSLAAWVVNLLVRRESEQVAQVLGVGVALREAQAKLSGEDLRALTRQRRQLTAAVTSRARAAAAEEGVRLTQSVADQVEATLTAAMLDAGAADAVRSGLLVAALSATGVDAVDVAAAVALPEALGFAATATEAQSSGPPPRPDLHVVPDTDEVRDARARRQAEETLEAAEAAYAEAAGTATEAQTAYATIEARSLQIQAEMDELRSRLADLEAASEETDEELAEAEETLTDARSLLADATQERDRAAEALAKLG